MSKQARTDRPRSEYDQAAAGLTAHQVARAVNTVRHGHDARGCSKGYIYELLSSSRTEDYVWAGALKALAAAKRSTSSLTERQLSVLRILKTLAQANGRRFNRVDGLSMTSLVRRGLVESQLVGSATPCATSCRVYGLTAAGQEVVK